MMDEGEGECDFPDERRCDRRTLRLLGFLTESDEDEERDREDDRKEEEDAIYERGWKR